MGSRPDGWRAGLPAAADEGDGPARALDRALAVADSEGVPAEGEILEGSPRRRISEFARDRSARLIVVGSRRRKLGQSVSTGVIEPRVGLSSSLAPYRD